MSVQGLTPSPGDALLCGGCHIQFNLKDFNEYIQHKMFGCDGSIPRRTSKEILLCQSCQESFQSPWKLVVHAQSQHGFKIFSTVAPMEDVIEESSVDDNEPQVGGTTEVGIQTGCCAAANASWEISSHKRLSGSVHKVIVDQQVASCCDSGECGVTVLPGTHERPRKCCSAVIPKKRKRHMETKHLQSIYAGKLKKKAMERAREKSPGTPKINSPHPRFPSKPQVNHVPSSPVGDFPLGFSTDAFMDSLLADVGSPHIPFDDHSEQPMSSASQEVVASTSIPGNSYQINTVSDSGKLATFPRKGKHLPDHGDTDTSNVPSGYSVGMNQTFSPTLYDSPVNIPSDAPILPVNTAELSNLFKNTQADSNAEAWPSHSLELQSNSKAVTNGNLMQLDPLPSNGKYIGQSNSGIGMKRFPDNTLNDTDIFVSSAPNNQNALNILSTRVEASNSIMISGKQGIASDKKRSYPTSRPFKCDDCDNSFNQRIHLKKHLSKHTGVKPFKCNQCDYSTVERSHLRVHLRVHTGEKPFKCNFCEYATAQNSTLKIHIKRHHQNTGLTS